MLDFDSVRSERLMKAADVANALNISRALAYRLIRDGNIPAVRIGSAVRIRPSDLEIFIRKCLGHDDHG